MSTKIAIVGLWHQGIVAAGCLADMGFEVTAADLDTDKIATLSDGRAPIFEPGLDELLEKGVKGGNLSFTTDLAAAVEGREFVFFMFDTPVDENDISDLTGVFAAAETIAPKLAPDCVIWNTAQVPVGSSEQIVERISKVNPDLEFAIVYSPENLRLGQAVELFRTPALPVIGSEDARALDRIEALLAPLNVTWKRVNLRTAEVCKHALNGFLATSISFANELGNLCDEVGADGFEVAKALRLEPRIGPKAMLRPGMGFSGGTLARDIQTLRTLGDRHGIETLLLDGLWQTNQYQNQFVVRRLTRQLGDLAGKEIAVLGITYKPGTSTLRRSVALETIAELDKAGAKVKAHDPKADREELKEYSGFEFCDNVDEALQGVDAVAIMTGWDDYKELDWEKVKGLVSSPLLIDCNNMLDGDALNDKGFTYFDIGRGRAASS